MNRKRLYRRKEEGKTDYKKRLLLLKSGKPRLVVRRFLNNISIQIVTYSEKGDIVRVSAHSNQLRKLGWSNHRGNSSSAYLTGLLCGLKAKSKNIPEAVLDIGLTSSLKRSALYSALKGVIDAGLQVPHSRNLYPEEKIMFEKPGFKEIKEKILKEKW